MTLERKGIRAKLDPDVHEALVKICERDGVDIGEFVDQEITKVVMAEIHKYIFSRSKFDGLGLLRKLIGKSGNHRE